MNAEMVNAIRGLSHERMAEILVTMLINDDAGVRASFIKHSNIPQIRHTDEGISLSLVYAPLNREAPLLVNFFVLSEHFEKLKDIAPKFARNKVGLIKEIREVTKLGLLEAKLFSEQCFGTLVSFTKIPE